MGMRLLHTRGTVALDCSGGVYMCCLSCLGHAANLLEVKIYQQVCHVPAISYKPLEQYFTHICCLVTKQVTLGTADFSCVQIFCAAYEIA